MTFARNTTSRLTNDTFGIDGQSIPPLQGLRVMASRNPGLHPGLYYVAPLGLIWEANVTKPKMSSLDLEELEIAESFEHDEWQSMAAPDKLSRYQTLAAALSNQQQVSIAFPADDLAAIQQKASEAGIPYQKLIVNIVHQFVMSETP